jgi:cob(I)alamin adenosyltransferase
MPIYTKTGDLGTTGLYGGKRVLKSALIVEAYGTVDELSSFIGLVATKLKNKKDIEILISIQKDLYQMMAVLSGLKSSLDFLDGKVTGFENKINDMDRKLAPLRRFIIPGGTEISSWFHVLRVLTRRAERKVVGLSSKKFQSTVKYLNRLSDLFFTMARIYGKGKEVVLK